MITVLQINAAINETLSNGLKDTEFEEIPLVAEDSKEPILRPSIKVSIEESNAGKFNSCCKERTLTIRVYFFASNGDKPKIENAKMREVIENTFTLKPLKVTDEFMIDIEEVESVVTDGVLVSSFALETLEVIPDCILNDGEEYELMENLDLEL
ncbi:phage tail terminator family protein [Clostridium butyricum]|uniref:Uncharacterized protein n=1 Tax=Clostridium butyricum E4 str. BoNT E BL5262 TaxID=632245 RepID=C4IGR7_CLOBU|nr:hypothetical protein [Clostridium butyricum]EDT74836.1 hypothetical protein CBY_2548 [Clostridium butyricum 5521]EEP53764.1 conserved hypothetical protein [Clostridium butyricum E4 str. BoNT E BL5262]NFL30485.1 hypothetical protein [Clostridium butyricum]NFS19440.1 hypothetical protein [Clostridium butyricum]